MTLLILSRRWVSMTGAISAVMVGDIHVTEPERELLSDDPVQIHPPLEGSSRNCRTHRGQ